MRQPKTFFQCNKCSAFCESGSASCATCGKEFTPPKTLALQVFKMHGFFLKLGPKIGGLLIKMTAFYCLYKILSTGGLEALSYVSYQHMIIEGEKEHGSQTGLSKKQRR